MSGFWLILLLLALIWFWYDSARARESAIIYGKRACDQIQAQLLDDTVSLSRLRLCRTNRGTMALCRLYRFDFSLDGEIRLSGKITMTGQRINDIVLDIDRAADLH